MNKDPEFFLEHILESIERVERVVDKMTKAKFLKSKDAQDIVARRVEIIGEAARNLPGNLREKYPGAPWKNIVGTRDFIVHEYFDVDMVLLWKIAQKDLPPLKRHILKILRHLKTG